MKRKKGFTLIELLAVIVILAIIALITVPTVIKIISIPEPPAPEEPTKVAAAASDTHKGIVYLDPTDLTNTCNADNSVSTTGTKTGCMKWYIYDDSGSNYTMILDHNTTETVVWNSTGDNSSMKEVATALATDTQGWQGSPRLITANEVARISGNTGFDQTISDDWFFLDSNNQTPPANSTTPSNWLFNNLYGCEEFGCSEDDSYASGYWTSTPRADNATHAWYVGGLGYLDYAYVEIDTYYGVRPVITISKSVIN